MDKLKKIFKHDKSDSSSSSAATTPSHTTERSTPATTTHSAPPPQAVSSTPAPAATTTSAPVSKGPPAGVLLETNYGNITIALYSDKTPRVSFLSPTR
jgi:peptidyl-prolyl cis-trans isomerase-like 1